VLTVGQATVCYSCAIGAPTISEPHLVYTPSNNRCLHQTTTHLQIIHVGWVTWLCLLHCLKSLFEKATVLSDGKEYSDIEKHSAQPF